MTLVFPAITFLILSTAFSGNSEFQADTLYKIHVPLQGNSWFFVNLGTPDQQVFDFRNNDWTNDNQVVRTYFRLENAGKLDIGMNARVSEGKSLLRASFNGEIKDFELSSKTLSAVSIGSFKIPAPGYYHVDIAGVKKEDKVYSEISDILLGGEATMKGVIFSDKAYFYWGRRGPSVHLSYQIPQQASDILWFYNEVTIPEGNDVIGSYFMADGFKEGYFGFQVNSSTERRILFSVWSPFKTDKPSEIPPEYRILLLKKGEDTETREFGNEGSGGQSFLRFMWKSGITYKFLLKVEPAKEEANKTDYTAYFFAPETGAWKLIASWRRPFTDTYAKGLYSFLENFVTTTGPMVRQGYFGNQWIYDTNNQWHELTVARFTADATARNKARLDYSGGLNDIQDQFFLKNCGFFDETTAIDSFFTRKATGLCPDIDFSKLP
jgi:hypothetical protein